MSSSTESSSRDESAAACTLCGGTGSPGPYREAAACPKCDGTGKQPSAAIEQDERAVALARRFHELYEQLAPVWGYETRPETRVTWDDLPRDNRYLMISVAAAILADIEAGRV